MRLSRPTLTSRSVSAPVVPTVAKPVGEQTLATLLMLRNMGYKEVWCQAADINEGVLERAAVDGWRVASISEGRVKMMLGQPPSPLTPKPASGATTPAKSFQAKPERPGNPRRPSERDLPTRAVTPPFREPSPSPVARLTRGHMSPEVAELIALAQKDALQGFGPGDVLSPGTQQMYMRSQDDVSRSSSGGGHRRQRSQASQRSRGSQKSHSSRGSEQGAVPAVVVSPPAREPEEFGGYGDYFSYAPAIPLPAMPAVPRVHRPRPDPHRRQGSQSSHHTIDDIAEDLFVYDVKRPFAVPPSVPESPEEQTPPGGNTQRQVAPAGLRFEVEERPTVQHRLLRALGPADDLSYIFLPSTPQAQPGSPRRPSAPPPKRDELAVVSRAPSTSRSDPGHGQVPRVASPPAVDPTWNGLNRKQTPHHRR